MGLEGEGSGGRGGGKWGERGREVGIGYPPVHPLSTARLELLIHVFLRQVLGQDFLKDKLMRQCAVMCIIRW